EMRREVEMPEGGRMGSDPLRTTADPAPWTCRSCGGVLSELKRANPRRFRCQVGHAYTADALATEQESKVDEALRVALRIIEERAELVRRMADDARLNGRSSVAEMYQARAVEYREQAEIIRRAVLGSFDPKP